MLPKRPIKNDFDKGLLPGKNRFFRTLIVLLVIVSFGLAAWRFALLVKNFQCKRFMQMAITFKQNGNNEDAKLALQTALLFWPDQSDLLRRLAQLCDANDMKFEASKLYGSIWRQRELSPEDTQRMLVLYLILNEPLRMRYLEDYINLKSGGGLLPLLLKAKARLELGDKDNAITDLQDAAEEDYNTGLRVLIAGQPQSLPPAFATTEDGFKILNEIDGKIGDRSALPIYIGLLKACVPWELQPEWAARLKKHPACDMRMHLLADAILVWRFPSTKRAIVSEILHFAKNKPLGDRILAAQWLLKEKEPAQAASLIEDDEALTGEEAFQVWFESNLASGQYQKLLVAVYQIREKLPYGIWLFRSAQALDSVGKTDASREARLAALEQGKKMPMSLLSCSNFLHWLLTRNSCHYIFRKLPKKIPELKNYAIWFSRFVKIAIPNSWRISCSL